MSKRRNTLLKIRVVDQRGNFMGGTVDVELNQRAFRERIVESGQDASSEIQIRGLRRRAAGAYLVTVAPRSGLDPQTQVVRLSPSGTAEMEFVFPVTVAAPTDRDPAATYRVTGQVSSPDRAGIGGLDVVVVDKNVGGDLTLAQVHTDSRGGYTAQFSGEVLAEHKKERPDLQVRVLSKKTLLGVSTVRYDADLVETINVSLRAGAKELATEHDALTDSIAAHYAGSLADLKETGDRQDISYLANKTGWDARAVALAALADRFGQIGTDPGRDGDTLDPVFYYALFRAGLPANERTLFKAGSDTVTKVWKAAVDGGVIPAELESELPQAARIFRDISAERLLTTPEVDGLSPLKDLLTVGRFSDEAEQRAFAALYAEHRTDLPRFWDAITEKFGAKVTTRLQTAGRVAFITLNNASLMSRIDGMFEGGLADPAQLAGRGFYQASAWEKALGNDVPVPDSIPGETPEIKRANYGAFMASQVRLSYPTAAVAHMVQSGALAVDVPDQVHAFLASNQGQFEIAVQPIGQYIAKTQMDVDPAVVSQLKRIQRVYQITSNDQAMYALLSRGFDSAHSVVSFGKDAFIRTFSEDLGGAHAAEQTFHKAAQVYNALLNVVVSYLTARHGVPLGAAAGEVPGQPPGVTGNRLVHAAPRAVTSDVLAYPTLEGLFGSMDFCECEHCRSILSPAAYLVDLLNFLDQPAPTAGTQNPQAVLLERRPDLEHLPLTCENTNTALPYIDVVNEMLEYFVSNDVEAFSLEGYEGHDTGTALSADLLASPQFVTDSAYDALSSRYFPYPLPFNRALENLRRHFTKFEVGLTMAMERFRVHDKLEHGAAPYGWRDILIEHLGISREEYKLFVDATAVPLWRMFGFANGTADGDVVGSISGFKAFARRLALSYESVIEVLKTRFVNPDAILIPKLEKLGVSFGAMAALKNGTISDAEFDALLPTGTLAPDPVDYGGAAGDPVGATVRAWVTDDANFTRIMGLIVLVDPAGNPDPCDIDGLEFRHAAPPADAMDTSTRIDPVEFARILRFIRLWKRTGWTIAQTDAALVALGPDPSGLDTMESLDAAFEQILPRLGVLVAAIDRLHLNVNRDLLGLLTLWAPIGTHGETALYRQMFLNPALVAQDPVFSDNGFGEFLADPAERLMSHQDALRSAFNLTADEFDAIAGALGFDTDTVLDIDSVSAVFRHGWLARKLSLSVRELLLFIELTGLDPFDSSDLTDPPLLRIIRFMEGLKARSLKSSVALYLIWNRDLSGKSSPDPTTILELARTLRADFAAVESELGEGAGAAEPGAVRTQMALVYGTDAAEEFFQFLEDTLVVDVPYTNPRPTLKRAITDADPRIGYDHFRHRLAYTGMLTVERRQVLDALGSVPNNFPDAVAALFDLSQDRKDSFFGLYPELEPLYDAWIASADPPEDRLRQLMDRFKPELARRRKRELALQKLTAVVAGDAAFTKAIVDAGAAPYPLHATGHRHRPALNDIVGADTAGLGGRFFFRNTATGNVDVEVPAAANLDYAPDGRNPLPSHPNPGHAISAIWDGRIEVPESGFYNLVVDADSSASVALQLDGKDRPMAQRGRIWRNADAIELEAGKLYDIAMTVERVRESVRIQWEGSSRPLEVIPGRFLYPGPALENFEKTYIRFTKAASLALALRMTGNELAHMATRREFRIGGDEWLNTLEVSGATDPNVARALLRPLEALVGFSRVKSEISPDDETLLGVISDPASATATHDGTLFTLTRWDPVSLTALVAHFRGETADLATWAFFERIYDAFDLLTRMGVAANAMIAATTNHPDMGTIRDLEAALRARYDPDDWRDVVQPVNDAMRDLRRDALVAYILHRLRSRPATAHIDTTEKLFEYFLTDVAMEPCMQTSRIRHALSSVQLFIERCLMNLEPRVSPASLNPTQWEWMKRYRVWEANRKVFLFPENWLEPELRDDKSPFFKEIEGELLQSDITETSAISAVLNYLAKLEEVAKLQPIGIHHVEADAARRTGEIDHVVARTSGSKRKYYYRRREYGYWLPWEPIKLDIEHDPVLPVVWDNRLLLFWVQILKEGPDKASKPGGSGHLADLTTSNLPGDPRVKTVALLSWSEYYNGKWQPAKVSDINLSNELWQAAEEHGKAFLRKSLSLSIQEEPIPQAGGAGDDTMLYLKLNYLGSIVSVFLLYNTHSSPVRMADMTSEEFLPVLFSKNDVRFTEPSETETSTDLKVDYLTNLNSVLFSPNYETNSRHVLVPEIPVTALSPNHPMEKPFEAPFFVDDKRHVFFVTTEAERKWIPDRLDFGVVQNPAIKEKIDIPPLVFEEIPFPIEVDFWGGNGPINPDPGVVDPAPIERFVTEDAYIRTGIGSAGQVLFDGKQIGPSGALGDLGDSPLAGGLGGFGRRTRLGKGRQ